MLYKHEYSVLNSIWPKSGLSEFWKNTLQLAQPDHTNLMMLLKPYFIAGPNVAGRRVAVKTRMPMVVPMVVMTALAPVPDLVLVWIY